MAAGHTRPATFWRLAALIAPVWPLAMLTMQLCGRWPRSSCSCVAAGPAHYAAVWPLATLVLQLCGRWQRSLYGCVAAGHAHRATVWPLAQLEIQLCGRWPRSLCHCVAAGSTRHATVCAAGLRMGPVGPVSHAPAWVLVPPPKHLLSRRLVSEASDHYRAFT